MANYFMFRMSLSKPTRPPSQLIDVPWMNLNQTWNAQDLEHATKIQRNWNDTLQKRRALRGLPIHHVRAEKPQVATYEATKDDQLMPLLALGGKSIN